MIDRVAYRQALAAGLRRSPAVAILGPRQVGKSSLAEAFLQELPAARRLAAFDLERPGHLDRLSLAPEEDLGGLQTRPGIIVIDEVQRLPGLFTVLRPLLDASSRKARYILLGSASPSVVRGVSESLAGRIAFLDLSPFSLFEVAKADAMGWKRLWMRGGLPRSFLARSDRDSFAWREEYMRAFVERDLPALGVGSAAVLVRRLLTMLAHWHGCVLNVAELASSLSVSHPTASHYLDLLEGAFMIRRVPPYWANVGKRLVKAPKVYLRDAGVLHQLLSLPSSEAVRSHPKVGASFEGWVIEPFYWRTHGGAEVDLLLRLGQRMIPIEVKLGDSPRAGRGMVECMKDLSLDRGIVMHGGADSYPLESIDRRNLLYPARAPEGPAEGAAAQTGVRRAAQDDPLTNAVTQSPRRLRAARKTTIPPLPFRCYMKGHARNREQADLGHGRRRVSRVAPLRAAGQ